MQTKVSDGRERPRPAQLHEVNLRLGEEGENGRLALGEDQVGERTTFVLVFSRDLNFEFLTIPDGRIAYPELKWRLSP